MPTSAARELTIAEREAVLLAPYAMHSADTRGRKHPEASHPYRGPFQRDRDRIVHSAAYRRLSYKTQVFTGEMGDYHRTRLTHTLEVASIARTLARALQLNEDLVEALALAHDIGHPPYGHAGEDVLDECLREHGGFNHNRQALRIVEDLELRYPRFRGLNLSAEVLEGQEARANKQIGSGRLLEVQVVDAADSIAYDTHDADDALELALLQLDALLEVPLWRQAAERLETPYRQIPTERLRAALVHELIDWQVGDILRETKQLLASGKPTTAAEVRTLGSLVQPSGGLAALKAELERWLYDNVYRHPTVIAKRDLAQAQLRQMFARLVAHPELLPEKFRQRAEEDGIHRATADYLSGMTDRFAQQEYTRIAQAQPN